MRTSQTRTPIEPKAPSPIMGGGVFVRADAPLVIVPNHEPTLRHKGLRGVKFDAKSHRANLFSLQSTIQKLLKHLVSPVLNSKGKQVKNKDGSPMVKPRHRVTLCAKHRVSVHSGVFVHVNKEHNKAQYGNLSMCGSVWTCPVCANKITTARSNEVFRAVQKAPAFAFLTLTTPHHLGMPLAELLELQSVAKSKFYRQRKVRELLGEMGEHGRITATECTWGEVNGWHPHYHSLLFLDNVIDADKVKEIQALLAVEWRNACQKAGMKNLPNLINGLDLKAIGSQDAMNKIVDYMTKYGCMPADNRINNELTKWHTKRKHRQQGEILTSVTPFELVALADADNPNCRYAQLFREFADAFKGKRQLVWSKGLKERYGIIEKSDDEILAETEKNSETVAEIPFSAWHLIVHRNERTKPLELAELDFVDGGSRLHDYIIQVWHDYLKECSDRQIEPSAYVRKDIDKLMAKSSD